MYWAALLVAFGLGGAVFLYNRLIGLQKRADGAWADIDAQLKRRHDLVPALVETVKGYAAHERTTLEEVVARRTEAQATEGATEPDQNLARNENLLAGAIRQLFALAEDYPQLRASERFGMLQQQLGEIEEDLQDSRRYYNAVVRDLNTRVASFPEVLIASPAGFQPRQFFEIDSPVERNAVTVDLDG